MLLYCLAARLCREHFKEKKTVSNVPCKSILPYDRHGDHLFIDFPNSSISSSSARFACNPVLYATRKLLRPPIFFRSRPEPAVRRLSLIIQSNFPITVTLGKLEENGRYEEVGGVIWNLSFLRKMLIVT